MISAYTIPGLNRMNDYQMALLIIEKVCEYYGETNDFINRKTRKKGVVKARYICMYMIKERTKLSLKNIGLLFHKEFDHTTVIHGINSVREQLSLDFDNEIKTDLEQIKTMLSYYYA